MLERIFISMDEKLKKALDETRSKYGLTRSEFIRSAILERLKNES